MNGNKEIPYDQTGTCEVLPRNEPLYHYTSLDGFCKIITGGKLWLTNICYMNDSQELYWLFRMVSGGSFRDDLSQQYSTLVDAIERVLNERQFGQVYATCFSEDGDSLPQWRAYADDGRGVAIGFLFDVPQPDKHVELQKVVYEQHKQQALLKVCKRFIPPNDIPNALERRPGRLHVKSLSE